MKDERFASLGLRDSETNLDPTLFRNYHSRLYRWLSPDPLAGDISNPQSLNRYAYVLNNPTNFIDPLGLCGGEDEPPCPFGCYMDFWVGLVCDPLFWPATGCVTTGRCRHSPPTTPGSGGGTPPKPVNKKYSRTFPCKTDAAGVMGKVEENFSSFATYFTNFGSDTSSIGFAIFAPGRVTAGRRIAIQSQLPLGNANPLLAPLSGLTQRGAAVDVTGVTNTAFTFVTVEGQHPLSGTISFSASDAGPGQVAFSINATANFAGPLGGLASRFAFSELGGAELEDAIWNNMLGNVEAACQ